LWYQNRTWWTKSSAHPTPDKKSSGLADKDGLLMGTRPGTLDPGAVTYLMRAHDLTSDAVEDMLYHHSGLAGVSGISSDMRTLLASDHPHAREYLFA
jgi:acetate kinase